MAGPTVITTVGPDLRDSSSISGSQGGCMGLSDGAPQESPSPHLECPNPHACAALLKRRARHTRSSRTRPSSSGKTDSTGLDLPVSNPNQSSENGSEASMESASSASMHRIISYSFIVSDDGSSPRSSQSLCRHAKYASIAAERCPASM